ncbi:StAR- lipid transfer protein 7, mitochondrial [Chamberlinius hualienensis]
MKLANSVVPVSLWKQLLALSGFRNFGSILNNKLILVGSLLARHCEFITAQRIRRACQTCALYSRLYSEASFKRMVSRFTGTYGEKIQNGRLRPLGMLIGAAFFSWEKEKITLEEMQNCVEDLDNTYKSKDTDQLINANDKSVWDLIINRTDLKVWQKPMSNTSIYEYKVCGSFYDITPASFFRVQVDIDYRKKWDKLVIGLDVVDRDQKTNCEVVHWVMHYPFPMYSRDYVYIRRYHIDPVNNVMVLVSKSTDHPFCPVTNNYVRVSQYSSSMVIKPHTGMNENGFDFVLTYFDDPQAMIPGPAYRWMASSGVSEFVEKLHQAAVVLCKDGAHSVEDTEKPSSKYQRSNNSSVVSNPSGIFVVN